MLYEYGGIEMNKYKLSSFKKRAEFGETKSYENENTGVTITQFAPKWSLYYCDIHYSINTSITVLGANQTLYKMIGIKHNPKINNQVLVKLDGVIYKIKNDEVDERVNGVDVLTIEDAKGVEEE